MQKGVLQTMQNFPLKHKVFFQKFQRLTSFSFYQTLLQTFISKCHRFQPPSHWSTYVTSGSILFFQEQLQTLSFQCKLTNSFLLLSVFIRSLLDHLTKTEGSPSPQKEVYENMQFIFSPSHPHSQIFMPLFWTKNVLRLWS